MRKFRRPNRPKILIEIEKRQKLKRKLEKLIKLSEQDPDLCPECNSPVIYTDEGFECSNNMLCEWEWSLKEHLDLMGVPEIEDIEDIED